MCWSTAITCAAVLKGPIHAHCTAFHKQNNGFVRGCYIRHRFSWDVYSLKLSYKGRGAKCGALQIKQPRAANSMAKSLECAESVNQQHDNSNEDNYPPTDRLMQLGRAASHTS